MNNRKSFLGTFLGILIVIVVFISFIFLKTSFTFSKITTNSIDKNDLPIYLLPELEDLPENSEDQLTFLLLGQRGEGMPFGGLLTDAITVANINKITGKVTLISLPRDIYIPMPNSDDEREKLNAVYAWGYEKGGVSMGIAYAKDTISRMIGLFIDNAIVINFEGTEDIVNELGGITITLDNDFIEDKQWWCDEEGENCKPFIVPKGEQTLDGETALFYMRSRFSSNDFDRARRQQQVMIAIKKKLFSLGYLANPLNILSLLNVVENNIRTDLSASEMKSLAKLYQNSNIDLDNIKVFVFDNGPGGYLDAKHINGKYILIPKAGNFNEIKDKCQDLII